MAEEKALSTIPVAEQIVNVQRLGNILAASGYFSDAREMAQAAVKILAGAELGIPPIAACMGIFVVKGKVVLSGNLIASRVRAHGYDYRHKQFDNNGCVLEFLSKPLPGPEGKRTVLGESSFTMEDAKAAGLIGSENYKKYPRNMFFNRAISNGAKWYTPEVTCGLPVYTPEEFGMTVDADGEIVQEEKQGMKATDPQANLGPKVTDAEKAQLTAAMKPPADPPALMALFAKMRNGPATTGVISGLGDTIEELTGHRDPYYEILAHYRRKDGEPIEHADQIVALTRKQVQPLVRELYEFIEEMKTTLENQAKEPEDANFVLADVPDLPELGV